MKQMIKVVFMLNLLYLLLNKGGQLTKFVSI